MGVAQRRTGSLGVLRIIVGQVDKPALSAI